MTNKKRYSVTFTAPRVAEFIELEHVTLGDCDVMVKMEYTAISGGTERACILGMKNTSGKFPRRLGYSGVGYVIETGNSVKSVSVGDRVLVYHGRHSNYNVRGEDEITKIEDGNINSLDAAFVIIASMGLGGVRKLELELGESAAVFGLGLLGMFSVAFLRLSGANPLIAIDPNPERRALALEYGADYALDPTDEAFADEVMRITKEKGVRATVEVTGRSEALKQALSIASYMGRISLLGCTRVSDTEIDYYRDVHRPGVRLIGAHNFVRPKVESYPHHWTHHDDCRAILDLVSSGRLDIGKIVSGAVSPESAPEIYTRLCDDPTFPLGIAFDWRKY